MLNAQLTRDTSAGEDGTFGVLLIGSLAFYTVEEDRRGNQRRVSCIPPGTYRCRRTIYYRHGYETFEVTDVPGRSRILIHPANTEEDVEGCIGVGLRNRVPFTLVDEDTGIRRTKLGVGDSQPAFRRLMDHLVGIDEFELTIIDPFWEA